ncbi:MAG: hypothetical protein R3330_06135, partial [Saprospiraceae bacterium]|nr:hypothetical protein [Saprospiraceae bacterium]
MVLLILLIGSGPVVIAQNVGINDTGALPNPRAVLDIDISTNDAGVLLPRLSTLQRTTLTATLGITEEGLVVYDEDLDAFFYWDGSGWQQVLNTAKPDDDWTVAGSVIYNMTDSVGIGVAAPSALLHVDGEARFSKGVFDGDIDLTSTASQLRFTHPNSAYLITLENSANTGIYYNTLTNLWEWRYLGISKGHFDLTFGDLQLDGRLRVDDPSIYAVEIGGDLRVGEASATDDDYIYFDSFFNEYLRWDDNPGEFNFSDDLTVDESLTVSGEVIYFDPPGNHSLLWDSSLDRFAASDDLRIAGDLSLGPAGVDNSIYFEGTGMPEYLRLDESLQSFAFSRGLQIDGSVTVQGTGQSALWVNGDVRVGMDSAIDDDYIYFDYTPSEFLMWDEFPGQFSFSDDLNVTETLTVDDDGSAAVTVGGDARIGMSQSNDDDYLYFDSGTNEYLQWDDSPGQFVLSDDLVVTSKLIVDSDGTDAVTIQGDLRIGQKNSIENDYLYFDFGMNEYLGWNYFGNWFVLSDDLVIDSALMITDTGSDALVVDGDARI